MLDETRLWDLLRASVLGAALTLSCSNKPESRATGGTGCPSEPGLSGQPDRDGPRGQPPLRTQPYLWGKFIWNRFAFARDTQSEGDAPGRKARICRGSGCG